MKIELTLEELEEMALSIVHNQLSVYEACIYVRKFALECHNENMRESE
jgi:hypothetical protein